MYKRKTLPLNNVLNRLIALSVCHTMTAENIEAKEHEFSSREAAAKAAQNWRVRANELELFAQTVMEYQLGDNNSIFNYHQQLTLQEDNELYERILKRIQNG